MLKNTALYAHETAAASKVSLRLSVGKIKTSGKPVSPTKHYNCKGMKKITSGQSTEEVWNSETHKRISTDLTMTLSNSGVQLRSKTV